MKVYISIDENNIITAIYLKRISESLIEFNVADPKSLHVGFDKVIDGIIVKNTEDYEKMISNAAIHEQISELKSKLAETDYLVNKFVEGEITAEEFAPIKAKRHGWRVEINELEKNVD